MIKRLLNPHILLKIALILTTLLLLLPKSSWATEYQANGRIRPLSVQGDATFTHTWEIGSNDKWELTLGSNDGTITSTSEGTTTLTFTLKNKKTLLLETSKPTGESDTNGFRKVKFGINPNNPNLEVVVQFGSKTLKEVSGEYVFDDPVEWKSSDKLSITITNNSGADVNNCSITSLIFYTRVKSDVTFNWANEVTSPEGYDISEIEKNTNGGITLSGKFEENGFFNFPLNPSSGSYTINYSSSNTDVAEVDNTGKVNIKSFGTTEITAVPQGNDDCYYSKSSYNINIESVYQFCELIVAGSRITTKNKSNITNSNITGTKVSYDSDSHTLTLNSATITGGIEYHSSQPFVIKMDGANSISVNATDAACIKSTHEVALTIMTSNESSTNENYLSLKHTGGAGSAINGVESIALGFGLYSLPETEHGPSDWIANAKEIFISDKKAYDLNIAGIQVTEGNRNNIFNDTDFPTVSYDGNGTLTLKNAEIIGQISVGSSIANLTINLDGRSFLANSNTIQSFDVTNSTSISFTTSNDLPGSLQFNGNDNIFPETYSNTVSYNGMVYENGDYKILKKTIENLTVHTFKTSTYNNGSPTYNHKDVYDDKQRIFYATELANGHNEENGRIYIKASSASKALSLFRRVNSDSFDDMSLISNVSLQFEWGKCTNTNVKVKVQEIEQGVSEITEGNDLSSWTDLPSEGRIVTINLTKAAKTNNIRLYFTSETDEFSFALLGVAYKSVEPYDLSFNNQFVSIINKDDIFGDGKASYDYEDHILTLNGVNLVPNGPAEVAGWNYMGNQDLTVKLKGKNNITDALFYNRGDYPGLNIKFISEATEPGSLYMTNRSISNSSETFSDVKENFVRNFTVVYDNTYYDYSRYENNDGGYIGTYSVLSLQPTISSTYSSGKRYVSIDNPAASTISGTIKYSISYADGTEGITDATYSEPFPIAKPATITSYIIANGKNSATTTAYRLGITQNKVSLVYGAETEEFTYAYNPQVLPAVEGIEVQEINFSDYFASMDGDLYVRGVGKGDGLVMLSIPDLHDYTLLNDTTYFAFTVEVLPEKPTFNVDAGTYNQTQKVTLASPYNDPNNIANELGTGGSANINIKYYLGETKPEEPFTYTGPITISESTKLTAWVEVKYEIPVMIQDQPGGNQTMTEIYESEAVTKSYVIDRNIANTTVTLVDDKTEFTYNESANVPTITRVFLTDGTETLQLTADKDYTISYVKVNGETEEAIEASKIINAGSYKMILTGKGNFSGTRAVEFTIIPRTITNLSFALSATNFTYNGEAQKPTVTVQFEETELEATKGTTKTIPTTDYDLTFSGECINAGTYSVSASLKGNYSGSGDGPSFTITKANITPKVTLAGWTYGATANTPSVSGNTGNGEVTYAYKLQNEAESAFAAAVPTNAGAYTVKASIAATANYEAASDTAQFTIAQAMPTLSFSTDKASLTMGEEVTGLPTLSNPGELAVTNASSDTDVATIEEDGTVKPVAPGTTTISATFAGNNNYEAITASYELTVNKAKVKTYGLWIGDTQVTEDNAEDILNATEDSDMPLYLFNAKNNTLIINKDQRGSAVIESRLPELKVYIMDTCMVKSIYYNPANTENTGTLTFTCNGNYPGNLTIANEEGISAIKGFSSVSYEYSLTPTTPKYTVYKDGQMMKGTIGPEGDIIDTVVADSVIIGIYIAPLTNGETNTVKKEEFEGVDVSNYSNGVFIFTLNPDNENPEEGDGIDTDENGETGIFVGSTMTDNEAGDIASNVNNKELTPGDGKYAEDYDGITFMVPAGNGVIKIDQIVYPGYEFHLKIGTGAPTTLSTGDEGRVEANVNYQVDEPTYCYLYMVEVPISARAAARGARDTRLGKRNRGHGTIYSVKVSPNKLSAANTPAQASGGIIPPSEEQGDEVETEGIQGVKVVNTVDNRWFTIDGRQIDKPTQKGLYIHNRKKVVVK